MRRKLMVTPLRKVLLCFAACLALPAHASSLAPVVEVEEDVYTYTNANNGSGPMWCSGSTSLVRVGERLFATGLETIPGAKPLNNCRWVLFERTAGGWQRVYTDDRRTREPSPVAASPDGQVLVSVNPTLGLPPEPNGGPTAPDVIAFSLSATSPWTPESLAPRWEGRPRFSEHSYRSFAADHSTGELILFQNVDYTHAEWTYRDPAGQWSAQGKLKWPWGAEYDRPQPIRVCYPNVAIQNRAVHFFGVSDILEPYTAWRDFKHQLTGQHWDYEFRRLFYTWTPDIRTNHFAPWMEIASRDKTCGWVAPCDLYAAPNGDVHLMWTERAIDERLREKFYPWEKQSHTLHHGVLRQGKMVRREILEESREDAHAVIGSGARFQVTPEERLFAFYFASGVNPAGRPVSENRLREITEDGAGPAVRIDLHPPLASVFTATVRAGSAPSRSVEMLGPRMDHPETMRYVRVGLF